MGFWDERFWLPQNVTWTDLRSNGSVQYPDIWELRYAIKYCVVLLFLRLAVECLIFLPIARLSGWMNMPLWYLIKAHLLNTTGKGKFRKVAETAWRFLFYSCTWVYGLYILWDQPQFSDVRECWRNWPHHPLPSGVWWYYVIETSFYWALLFSSVLFDVRRADFYQMTLHHLITIMLLFMSYAMNMIRVGTLILFSHDLADIFLEFGKLCRYAKWETALKIVYVFFIIVWTGTRLIYFPFWIISSVIFDAPALIQVELSAYAQIDYRWENLTQRPIVPRIFVAMLLCLLFLHVFWTYVIVKIAVKSTQGNIDDIREEEEEEDEVVSNGTLVDKKMD